MPSSKDTAVVFAENVFKIYDMGTIQVKALDGVTFTVAQGEFVSIMGASGSGKTTLLDVVSCMHRPTRGEVYIKGKPISAMSDTEFAHTRGHTIGFVFQTFNLVARLTALENVMLPLWFAGKTRAERETIAHSMLADVGLADRADHKPGELSGGQRQRVAIARALAVNPEVIVADEPTGNLDSKTGEQILELIEALHQKKNKTILMVTHEEDIAARADRTIYLKDGKILHDKRNSKKGRKNA
jgi:putative ABC transport system ATP-binding protein